MKPFSLPMRWAMKSSGKCESEEEFLRQRQRRNCCKHSTVWRKRRHGIGSRSEKPAPAGSFRRGRFWRRYCRRFRPLSCLSWRGIFHKNWEIKLKFQMGGLWRNRGPPSFFSRKGALTHHPKGQWYFLRKTCALRGGCGCCGSLQTMPQHLRVLLSSSAQFTAISVLETVCSLPAQTCHRQLYLRL